MEDTISRHFPVDLLGSSRLSLLAARWSFSTMVLLASLSAPGCFVDDDELSKALDPDEDGYAWSEDCDSEDPSVNVETMWFLDVDGDGFGQSDQFKTACARPSGYAESSGDCNDDSTEIHPDQDELCGDSVDNNCNGFVDEDDAVDASYWYPDADGDGYGDSSSGVRRCEAPSDTIADGTDCDDSSPSVYPGAMEICDNGQVDDCDSDDQTAYSLCAPFGEQGLAAVGLKFVGEDIGDWAGNSVAGVGDVDGDGLADVMVGAPYHAGTGAAYLVLGSHSISGADLSQSFATLLGEGSDDRAGARVAGAGDFNADGHDDILIGAHLTDTSNGSESGAVYLFQGPVASGRMNLSGADHVFWGENAYDEAGYSVAGVGDVNGDGYMDLLVGAFREDTAGSSGGAAYLVLGSSNLPSSPQSLETSDVKFVAEGPGDWAGLSVSGAGDMNGDGVDDVLIAAEKESSAGELAGAVYVVLGQTTMSTGVRLLSSADAKYTGESRDDRAGEPVACAGDVNNDGYSDVLIGARVASNGDGAAYLLLGASTSPPGGSLSAADVKYTASSGGSRVGESVAGVGDVNADDYDDVLIAARGDSRMGTEAGAVFLQFGVAAPPGTVDLDQTQDKYLAENEGDQAGESVAGAGDVNGDGLPDFLIGAYGEDSGGDEAGAAYLILNHTY
ncbi:MAG: FG-GAP repeat protein [Alphaproteobacteria bacterium]|nr:FG-GAP repeat protein [Alphaproteobacteria bacterium]